MAIELDAEQRRNLKKQGIDLNDLIDFPCSPTWASYYAGQGMTKDYPPEYYQQPNTELLRQIRELQERIQQMEKSRPVKYIIAQNKGNGQKEVAVKGGASLKVMR